jgi:hypothetical protein
MNNELRNRALYLIAAHYNANDKNSAYHKFTPEKVAANLFEPCISTPLKTAINNALVTVNFTKGELTILDFVNKGWLDDLHSELETILSEIDTKSKEKEAEEKLQWLAEYESTRPEVCPHQPE